MEGMSVDDMIALFSLLLGMGVVIGAAFYVLYKMVD